MAGSAAIPCLRYRDAPAAITWLCNTFGFVEHLVVAEKDGSIAHAQLNLGTGMIMLGSVRDNDYGRHLRQPDENGGLGTQGIYLVVADVDAVHARTVAFLEGVSAEDLDRVVDERWDPPVTLGVRLVSVLDDDLQHAGQAAYARGLLAR